MEWLLKVIWVLPIATAVIGILGIIHGIRKGGSWLIIVRDIVVTVGLTALFCMVPGILKDHYKQISSAKLQLLLTFRISLTDRPSKAPAVT